MTLNLRQLIDWPPEIADLAHAARDAGTNHADAAEFYRSLMTASTWEGQGAEAARAAMTSAAGDHQAVAEGLSGAADIMDKVREEADALGETIKGILDDAAAPPTVTVDESTNQVIPPDTSYMTEEYAAQVAAKVADLQARIAAALADGQKIDAELAGAITAASGAAEQTVKTAGSLPQGMGGASSGPQNLDDALNQLTGEPGDGTASERPGDAAAGPVPLNPAKVDQFRELARQTMLRDGVPPEQIEQRLDAIVAAAQKPLPASKPFEREAMPKPGFEEGFRDGWFNTEESIKNLVGANGWEHLKDSWTDMAGGSWERITNPIDAWQAEAEHLTKYPGHYLGEIAGESALTAPAAMFGGEAALAAHGAGAAIPDSVVDMPSGTGGVEHSTPLVDAPSHHGTAGPIADAIPPPLPPDSPLFDGYDPIPPGPEFTGPDGGLIYPDASLPDKPYALPGTIVDNAEIPQGTVIDRFGTPFGSWLSPDGTPFTERALPPDSASKPYYQYVVDRPANLPPGFRIEQSDAAPWFHQPGGGVQYRIIGPDGRDASVNDLLESGYLRGLHE